MWKKNNSVKQGLETIIQKHFQKFEIQIYVFYWYLRNFEKFDFFIRSLSSKLNPNKNI